MVGNVRNFGILCINKILLIFQEERYFIGCIIKLTEIISLKLFKTTLNCVKIT